MDLKEILLLAIILLFVEAKLSQFLNAEGYNPLEIFSYGQKITPRAADNISRTLFVSAWTNQGKKYAIKYAHRFDTMVLCLYDLQFTEKSFTILKTKEFDFNFSFLKELKRMNKNIKILLRIYVISSSKSIFEYIGSSTKKIGEIASQIMMLVKKYRVQGIFYDSDYSLPYKSNFTKVSSYDKFASLLNSYIVNKISEIMNGQYLVYYGVKNPLFDINDIDFHAFSQLKVNAFMIATLENKQYFPLIQNSIKLLEKMRQHNSLAQYHFIVPLFSRRNGMGIKTSTVKKSLQGKQVAYKGFSNGVCMLVQRQSKATNLIPCGIYFDAVIELVRPYNIGIAYYQAGDAIQIQFDLI